MVDGGASDGDTIFVAGAFTTTSLAYSTIHIMGSSASDTVDITGLTSADRVVFDSNGGSDTVIGPSRPQDVITGLSLTGIGAFGDSDGLGALLGGARLTLGPDLVGLAHTPESLAELMHRLPVEPHAAAGADFAAMRHDLLTEASLLAPCGGCAWAVPHCGIGRAGHRTG